MTRAYADTKHQAGDRQRRDPRGPSHGKKRMFTMHEDSPAVLENRTRYPHMVGQHAWPPLKSGYNNTKIGKTITKGRWAGMPIYTLTLEERATCGPCAHKLDCYGNSMVYAARQKHGPELIDHLRLNLWELNEDKPDGFMVRLHVLGDFYSIEYVRSWMHWIDIFPALHIYGYTARQPHTPIGMEILKMMARYPDRVAMRFSDGGDKLDCTVSIEREEDAPKDAIVCPAQTDKVACCATCALCWDTRKNIAFISH